MKHEPAAMIFESRTATRSRPTNRFRSGFNVWWIHVVCPTCQRKSRHLMNAVSGKTLLCDGTATHYRKEPSR